MGEEAIPRKASPKRRPARWSRSLAPSGDERISTRAAAGDEAAFTEIYERYHQPLYRYCRSILRNEQDAEDALQSTMTSALTALRSGGKEIALRPWLFRVAHNESISLLRRRRPNEVPADEQALLTAPSASEPGETLERRERLADLVKDLDSLAVRQRSALLMRELSGLSIEEIAGALSTTPAAAKQALFEARTALRERVEGRSMDCDTVSRMIFEGDGRVLRGRKVRSHLASCKGCSDLVASMRTRSADLHALAPALPAVAASAILTGLLGHGSGAAAGAGASAGAGAAAGTGAAGSGAGTAGGGAGSTSAGLASGVSGTAGSAAAGAGVHIGGALAVKATIGVLIVAAAAGGATQLTSSGGRPSSGQGSHATQLSGGAANGEAPANGEGSLGAKSQQSGTAAARHGQGAGAPAGSFVHGLDRGRGGAGSEGLGGAGRGKAGGSGSSTAHEGTAPGSAGRSGMAHHGEGHIGAGHRGASLTGTKHERGAHSRGTHSEGRGSRAGSRAHSHLRRKSNGKHAGTEHAGTGAGDRKGAAGGTSHRPDSQRAGGEGSHPHESVSRPHVEGAEGNPGGTSSGRSGAPSAGEGRSVTERERHEGSVSSDNAPSSKAATGGSETSVTTMTKTRSSETALSEAGASSPSGAR